MQTTFTAIESYDPADFPQFAALYEDEQLHVGGVATGRSVRNDYGVPGSPVWYDMEDILVDEFEINGVAYTWKQLNVAFPKIADDLHVICAEAAEKEEGWD